jgi:hypothetical protein
MTADLNPHSQNRLFELTTFLEGRSFAWGVFEDRFGRVRRRFTVELNGRWNEGSFELDEEFFYDDGSRETRSWRVTPTGGGRFTATCADCVGEANGSCDADTIRMSYRFRLRIDSRVIDVDFDDRIYFVGDGVAVNRATMSKWGVRLGDVSLFFRRADASALGEADRAAA